MPPKKAIEVPRDTSIDGVSLEHYGSQAVGGAYKTHHTRYMVEALADPAAYMASRLAALEVIDAKIDTIFAARYRDLIASGVLPEDAKARAKAYSTTMAKLEYDELALRYPEDIQQTAANISYKKSVAGQNGFNPSAVRARKGRK